MLSSVLRSERAIQVNIQIMRAFTQLRKMLSTHEDLKRKIESMERKYDQQFQIVFEAIKQLLSEEDKPKKKIGYTVKEKQKTYGKKSWGVRSGFKTFNQVQSQGGPRDSNAGIYIIFQVLNPSVQHRNWA